jgi:hypothetical protein
VAVFHLQRCRRNCLGDYLGVGGYLFGTAIHRIAGPVGWALLTVALIGGFGLWRYYKKHEEGLLAKAELEMSGQDIQKPHEMLRN